MESTSYCPGTGQLRMCLEAVTTATSTADVDQQEGEAWALGPRELRTEPAPASASCSRDSGRPGWAAALRGVPLLPPTCTPCQ